MTYYCNSRKPGHPPEQAKAAPGTERAGADYCGARVSEPRRCHWHGGASLKGDQSGTWKTGEYSKHRYRVSDALAEALEYRDSEDWRELNQHGWMLVGMIQQALDEYESPMPTSGQMFGLLRGIKAALAGNDPGGANFKAEQAIDLMRQFENNWGALGKVSNLIEQHRKLAESADKQDLTQKAMLHIDDVSLMLADVAQIVSKAADVAIPDPAQRMLLMEAVQSGLLLRGDEHAVGREIPLALQA
jgi:hypothetical protein